MRALQFARWNDVTRILGSLTEAPSPERQTSVKNAAGRPGLGSRRPRRSQGAGQRDPRGPEEIPRLIEPSSREDGPIAARLQHTPVASDDPPPVPEPRADVSSAWWRPRL